MSADYGARRLTLYGKLDPRYLLHYAALDEANVAITGLPGTGKTTLVKMALKNLPEGFSAIVFDTARDYEDECDVRGEFSIDVKRIKPLYVINVIEEALEAVYGDYTFLWTPAMSELVLRALGSGMRLADLMKIEPENVYEYNTTLSVRRRAMHFQYPHFGDAPLLEPKPGAVTCVDMHGMDPVGRVAYVLLALYMLQEQQNIFYIIDEAHRFMQTREASIIDIMRMGRHNMQLFVLITQSLDDLKRREGYIKILVRFREPGEGKPTWDEPHKALVTIYVTNRRAAKALPGKEDLRHYMLAIEPPGP